MGVLTVVLERIDNLKDKDGIGKSDPYVKFRLEQDNMVFDKNYGKKQSSVKDELNPEYNETFEWDDVPSLENMVLWIDIMDSDIGRDDKLGDGNLKLEHANLESEPKTFSVKANNRLFRADTMIYLSVAYTE